MRRLCLILLVTALGLPASGSAFAHGTGTVGSMGVAAGAGTVIVQGDGVIYGQIDQGTLMIVSYRPDDPTTAISVAGTRPRLVQGATVYAGSAVRFLLPAGRYTIELIGTGVNASAVGRGIVGSVGFGTANDGSITINGGRPQAITTLSTSQTFGGR